MQLNKPFILVTLACALAMSSCYHEFPSGGGGNGGGGGGGLSGNTIVYFTVTSTPSQTFSFPSQAWIVDSITFVDASGNAIGIGTPLPLLDFNRSQTDSIFLGHAVIPAGTYSQMKISLGGPFSGTFYNSSNATLLGCAPATVCPIPATVPGYGAASVLVPFTFTGNSGGSAGVTVNFDLSKAVTTAGGMTFDFSQTGAVVPAVLPRTSSLSTPGLDQVQNFTGTVTATTSSSVTVQPLKSIANGGVFSMASNVQFDDPFAICTAPASFSCLAMNQNVSIDGVLNADGTMTAYEVEFLDPAPVASELEGTIIAPVSNGQFKVALTNNLGNSFFNIGTLVTVMLSGAETYAVDPKNLGISTTVVGFQSQTDLVMGQTVMLKGGTITDATETLSDPTRVLLRYSSIPGTVATTGSPVFTMGSIAPFFVSLTTNSAQVQTFPNTTYSNITQLTSLTQGAAISVRGLYLNPSSGVTQPIQASEVRTH